MSRYISTMDDLIVYIDEAMGQNATESIVRAVADALVRDVRVPAWDADWSEFVESLDLWAMADELGADE